MSDSTQPELPAIGFVQELDPAEREDLSSHGEFLSCNEGDVIIEELQKQDSLFLVIMGNFHVQTETTGKVVLLGQLKAGDAIGEINMFDPGQASASVIAKSFSQVWKIDRASLERFLETHPVAAARLLVTISTQLSKRLRHMNEKVALAMIGNY